MENGHLTGQQKSFDLRIKIIKQEKINKIINKLIEKHISIPTMKSCTSGLIASFIADTEGASSIFPSGYVTYCNETEISIGVEDKIIRQYGV